MNYAKWETLENVKKLLSLEGVDGKQKIKSSGLPICYDDKNLYIDTRKTHSLIVGTTGSGKTQVITLPMLELSLLAGESVVIHDTTSEIYEKTQEKFLKEGYNVIKIDFDNMLDTKYWNPFELPYKLYKEGKKDKSQDLVEELGYYLFNDLSEKVNDPFWINSAIDYFTGITLYAFEKEDIVNFDTIFELDSIIKNDDKFIEKVDKNSNIYMNLKITLEAPKETKLSIISVFDQKIKKYISRENLKNMLSTTNFDILNIAKEKTIVYIVSGSSNNSEHLLPLLISQIYFVKKEYSKNIGRINILIDDFFELYPFKNFARMLNYARSINIIFTVVIRGFNDLKNIYGKENCDIIKMNFGNIVYLLSQDIDTLEEISKLCGNFDGEKRLINVEELKTLKMFEAILLTPRVMPFKTKLLPYYEIEKSL